MTESRVHSRVSLRIPAICAGAAPDGALELSGSPAEVENVCEHGLCLRAPLLQPTGTRVEVWLAPEGMPVIKLSGQVAWHRESAREGGGEMGIRVDDQGPNVFTRLLCLAELPFVA